MTQLQSYNKVVNEEGVIPAADILSMIAISMTTSSAGSALLAEVVRAGFAELVEQNRLSVELNRTMQTLANTLTSLEVKLTG